jgi:hypothetical protein
VHNARHFNPRFIAVAGCLFVATAFGQTPAETPPVLDTPIVLTQVPATAAATGRCVDGSRLAVLDPDGRLTVLTPEFAAACDPDVSFDGRRVLFAARREHGQPLDIFEKAFGGSPARRLTHDLGDCREPLYLPSASVTPPTFEDRVPWIAFTSTAAGVLDELGEGPATSLYVTNLEPVPDHGTVLWRTTYNLGGDFSPTILGDGRVLYSSRQLGRVKLLTITWAGDNVNLFADAQGRTVQSMASEIPGHRSVVAVDSDGAGRGGRLVEISLRRPLKLREVLSRGDGRYLTPHGLADGRILVSYRADGTTYGLYLFDRETGAPGAEVFDDPEFDDIDARPAAERPQPLARIPMLEFASVLDIKGFEKAGQLQCLSVYDSDDPAMRDLAPGMVKWARFVRGNPVGVADGERCRPMPAGAPMPWPPPCVETSDLGVAPVENDGSFFVNIAGNVPFYINLLDADRRPVKTMRSWIWIRSKSQRGCIGCHEDKELAPPNRATDALRNMHPTLVTGSPAGTGDDPPSPTAAIMASGHTPTRGSTGR